MSEFVRRAPQTVAADGTSTTPTASPLRRETFTTGDDDLTRARQFETLQKNVADASAATRSNRHNRGVYFEDQTVTSGQTLQLRHNLGIAKVYVNPVRWAPAVSGTPFGWQLGFGTVDESEISIQILATGVVTFEVF